MKFALSAVMISAVLATASAYRGGQPNVAQPTPAPATDAPAPAPATAAPPAGNADPNLVAATGGEIGLSQVNPDVPGNPCLTGRNNGEFVFATCTLEAVDRRFVQGNVGGQPALIVQRQYDANFDGGEGAINDQLAGGQNCLGIRPDGLLSAVPCSQGNNARLENGEIRIGNQCITGGINEAPLNGRVTIGNGGCTEFETVQP